MAKRCSRSGLSCGPEGTKLGGLGEINVVGTVWDQAGNVDWGIVSAERAAWIDQILNTYLKRKIADYLIRMRSHLSKGCNCGCENVRSGYAECT